MHTVTLMPGDGIGPSICEAAVRVLEVTGVKINWERYGAGIVALEKSRLAWLRSSKKAKR